MTPRHHESDTKVHRGRITKQGNNLVRWAAVEEAKRVRTGPIGAAQARIAERRGGNIATVAAAANCSPSSTTVCATHTSVAWPRRRRDPYTRCSQDAWSRKRRDQHHRRMRLAKPRTGPSTVCGGAPMTVGSSFRSTLPMPSRSTAGIIVGRT